MWSSALATGACSRSEPTFFRATDAEPTNTQAAADRAPPPYVAEPVAVEPPADTMGDEGLLPDAATAPGREAAGRYIAQREGTADAGASRRTGTDTEDPSPAYLGPAPSANQAPLPDTSAAASRAATVPAEQEQPRPTAAGDDPGRMNRRAIALINTGHAADAIPLLERALALQPRDAEMLGNLGYAYMLAGDYREAKSRFMSSLELAPTRSATWLNLGQTYAEMGRRDLALDAIMEGYRYSSRKPSVHSALQRAATGERFSQAWRETAGLALDRIDGRSS